MTIYCHFLRFHDFTLLKTLRTILNNIKEGKTMNPLPSNLKSRLKRANAQSKGIKARVRELSDGTYSVYLDIHTGNDRNYEQTNYRLSCRSENKLEDIRTLIEIEQLLARKQQDILESRLRSTVELGNDDVIVLQWFKSVAAKESYNSVTTVMRYLELFLREHNLTNLLFRELNYKICMDFFDFLKSRRLLYHNGKLLPNTVNIYMMKFKTLLNRAVSEEILLRNPAKQIKTKLEETTPDYLSKEEIQHLINVPAKYQDVKNAALFSVFTALRVSDIFQLKHSMIRNGTIYLQQKKTKTYVRIPLSDDANKILAEQRERYENTDQVFHITSRYMLNNHLKKWLSDAGLLIGRKLSFHSFRHTAAMQLLNNGTPLPTISKILGHSSIQSTMTYQKVRDESVEAAIKSVPSFFT